MWVCGPHSFLTNSADEILLGRSFAHSTPDGNAIGTSCRSWYWSIWPPASSHDKIPSRYKSKMHKLVLIAAACACIQSACAFAPVTQLKLRSTSSAVAVSAAKFRYSSAHAVSMNAERGARRQVLEDGKFCMLTPSVHIWIHSFTEMLDTICTLSLQCTASLLTFHFLDR